MGSKGSNRRRALGKNSQKRDDPAREPLLWHNGYFGRGRGTIKVRRGFTSVNSPLFQNAELLDEILKYAYVPKDVAKAYREHALKSKRATKGDHVARQPGFGGGAAWRNGRVFLACPWCARQCTRLYQPLKTSDLRWPLTYSSRQHRNYKDKGPKWARGLFDLREMAYCEADSARKRRREASLQRWAERRVIRRSLASPRRQL
jgi:hypothetical protein